MKFGDKVKFNTHEGYVLSNKTGVVVGFHVNPIDGLLVHVKLDEPLDEPNCSYIWNNYKYISEDNIEKVEFQ